MSLPARFLRAGRMSDEAAKPARTGALIGIGGLALAMCCIAAPAILEMAIGATIGNALDASAAVLVAIGVAIVLHRRRTAKGKRC